MVRDARYALRALAATPLLTVITVLTVALGIGATTAIFSVVNTVLLQPLPYAAPDRLVRIVENVPAEESRTGVAMRKSSMNQDEFDWWRTRSQTLSHLAMITPESRTLRTAGGTVLLAGARVTPALFPMRGVAPLLGRGLLPEEERPDPGVVVISESTWRRYFAADPDVIGQTVVLDGRASVIVGVMPPEFGDEAFWSPLFEPPGQPGRIVVANVAARLRDGVSLEAASAEANVLGLQLRGISSDSDARLRFEIVRELDQAVAIVVPALRVLAVAVVAVLLIVCTNVANLLLARGTRRQNEIAIRRSLGATRGRVARQVLTESFVLAGLAGLAGVALAYWGVELLKDLAIVSLSDRYSSLTILPRIDEVSVDPTVLAFAAGLSLVTGVLFGSLPALRLSRFDEMGRASATQDPAAVTHARTRNALATVQIAFAMTLLIGAGLLLHSFSRLAGVDVGFDGRNTLSFDLVIPGDYTAERKLEVAEALAARLSNDPRVSSVGFTDGPPLQPNIVYFFSDFIPAGYTAEEIGEEQAGLPGYLRTQSRYASAGYLRALGARLASGRWLEERQGAQPGMNVLVSGPFARHYFARMDPVGSTIQSRWGTLTIVGVVDDIYMRGPDTEPERIVFLEPRQVLTAQRAWESTNSRFPESARAALDRSFLTIATGRVALAVRTAGDPLAILGDVRSIAGEVDPALAIDGAMTMDQILSGITMRPRFYAVLLGVFGAVAAFIAAIGIYGVLAYVVGLRTNEIGIRIALGAERRAVMKLILRQGVLMVAIGVGAGLTGAAWLSRYLEGMLFGLSSFDIATYAVVAASFTAFALVAAYVPARRATGIDPLAALRYE